MRYWRFAVILIGAAAGAGIYAGVAAALQAGGSTPSEDRLIRSIQGPDLYRAYCAPCHGADARGDGPAASALRVRPKNLRRIAIRNKGVFPTDLVRRIILGDDPAGTGAGRTSHGSREMPIWGPIFSQVDRDMDLGRVRADNVARYLRDIQDTQ